MRSPFANAQPLIELEEVDSTQTRAKESVRSGEPAGGVIARFQTAGVGRFGRTWLSGPGDSLTVSLIFRDYTNHPQMHLLGMWLATAAASALHCQLQWPNDLIFEGQKLGGILTEVVVDSDGNRVPIVGMGINLNQESFPEEIATRATSLRLVRNQKFEAKLVLDKILDRLQAMPEPNAWPELEPIWAVFDRTPGKTYLLPSGESSIAIAVGSSGELMCSVGGESQSVLAADAILGESAASS